MTNLSFPTVLKEYRPELNGLRAVAVLLVLFFHLDMEWMKGGFLGVDIFLVISGYFISRNIVHELQHGKFTFYGFYTKRLRRLFPALIVTLFIVLITGYFILTPSDFERLGKSTIYSSLSLSNFFFWGEAGYFNTGSVSKPLLHMWSLSLEEQFYLFWPLLLFLLYKFVRKYMILFVSIFTITSIVICEIYFSNHPEAVFFLIPFRMFEFLLGASCVWLEQFTVKIPKITLEPLFLIGLFLIGYSSVSFDGSTQMPGLLSLIPCSGAILVILTGKTNYSSWLLKNKPVELIGKASYSIYLIHWPLVVFLKYYTLKPFTPGIQFVLAVMSILLGIMMWNFIENTFRYVKNQQVRLDRIWIGVPISILCIITLSSFIWQQHGLPNRFSDQLYMSKEDIVKNRERYFDKYRSGEESLLGNTEFGHVMIMGNSHSIDLIYMLKLNGFEPKITALNSLGKCYNFGQSYAKVDAEKCDKQRIKNLNDPNWGLVDAVYLHDNWPQLNIEELNELLRTIRSLTDVPIYVIGPKMTYTNDIPEIVHASKSVIASNINEFAHQFEKHDQKVSYNVKLKKEFENPSYEQNKIYYIDLLEIQGGKNFDSFEIVSSDNLEFLYFDFNHFTEEGAKKVGAKLKEKHPELFRPID